MSENIEDSRSYMSNGGVSTGAILTDPDSVRLNAQSNGGCSSSSSAHRRKNSVRPTVSKGPFSFFFLFFRRSAHWIGVLRTRLHHQLLTRGRLLNVELLLVGPGRG